MAWTTLALRVATPLFNGGADPADDYGLRPADEAGVRVASIRGAMRFWFRAMAGALTGPDLPLLAGLERRVFGGVGTGDDGASASPVMLRIPRQPAVVLPAGPHDFLPPRPPQHDVQAQWRYRRDSSRWILYLMGQGLADLAKFEVLRPYVAAGQEFDLKVGFRHARDATTEERAAIEGLVMASLWLTCTYGGIGARARRGFGGVRIIGATGGSSGDELPLPAPWTSPSVVGTPGLRYYEQIKTIWPNGPVASCMRYISALAGGRRFNPGVEIPVFPVMSKTYAPAGVSGGDPFMDWKRVLIHVGEQWRHFRAAEPNTSRDARYDPFIETPEWIKTVKGTERESRFPLGALGLPVVYKERYLVNADGAGHDEPQRRRASPLWLRVVGDGDEFRLLSYAFQGEFLPGQVRLWRGNTPVKPVQVTNDDVKRQTDQWIKVLGDDDTFVPDPDEPAQHHRRLTGGVGR
jgi:hypothetical protein